MTDLLVGVNSDVVSWQTALLSLLVALIAGQWLAALYARTYHGMSYSRNMVQALVLAGVVAAVLMMAIGNNLVRGIGIIGTLALIRFRTNLRDPWDMVFIFAVFAVGIAAGTQSYSVAVIGTVVFSGVVWMLHKSDFGSRQEYDGLLRLQIATAPEEQRQLQAVLQEYCRSFVLVTLRELAQGTEQEHAYQVRLWEPQDRAELVHQVSSLPGARAVTLHMQEATVEL